MMKKIRHTQSHAIFTGAFQIMIALDDDDDENEDMSRSCSRIRDAPPRLYRNDPKARANFCFCEIEQRGLKGL